MMRRTLTVCALLSLVVTPLWAGYHYKAVTTAEGQGSEAGTFTVEGWIDGGKAKILFEVSGNPMMPAGSYLLTTDGGHTLYLVNPQEKTYSKWDLEAMLGALGSLMESMGGMMQMEVSDPKVETLLAEDGGSILGYPTTHYRFRTSYMMQIKVMGMKRGDAYVVEQDTWYTTALDDEGFSVWLVPRKTGFEAVDKLMAAELEKAKGFPLRSIVTTTTTGAKRQNRTGSSVSRTEVTVLDEMAVPASTFALDPTFTEVPMMAAPGAMPMEGEDEEEQEEEEEKGGMFKRLKKRVSG